MKLKQTGSNQTELHLNNGTIVLFSYETPVASKTTEQYNNREFLHYLRTNTKYSCTTTKHINNWIKDGYYNIKDVDQSVLDDLVDNKMCADGCDRGCFHDQGVL